MQINNFNFLPTNKFNYQARQNSGVCSHQKSQPNNTDSVSFSGRNEMQSLKQILNAVKRQALQPIPSPIIKKYGSIIPETALKVAYNIRNEKTENIFLFNELGNINKNVRGIKDIVYAAFSKNDFVSVHNHPNKCDKCPFSFDDIRTFLKNKIKTNIVSSHNGFYLMTIPQDIDKEKSLKIISDMEKKFEKVKIALRAKFQINNTFSQEKANNILKANNVLWNYLHKLWETNAEKLGFKYEYQTWASALQK